MLSGQSILSGKKKSCGGSHKCLCGPSCSLSRHIPVHKCSAATRGIVLPPTPTRPSPATATHNTTSKRGNLAPQRKCTNSTSETCRSWTDRQTDRGASRADDRARSQHNKNHIDKTTHYRTCLPQAFHTSSPNMSSLTPCLSSLEAEKPFIRKGSSRAPPIYSGKHKVRRGYRKCERLVLGKGAKVLSGSAQGICPPLPGR